MVLCSLRDSGFELGRHLYRLLWTEVIAGKSRDHIEEKLVVVLRSLRHEKLLVVLCSWREEKLLGVLGSVRAALAKAEEKLPAVLGSLRAALAKAT